MDRPGRPGMRFRFASLRFVCVPPRGSTCAGRLRGTSRPGRRGSPRGPAAVRTPRRRRTWRGRSPRGRASSRRGPCPRRDRTGVARWTRPRASGGPGRPRSRRRRGARGRRGATGAGEARRPRVGNAAARDGETLEADSSAETLADRGTDAGTIVGSGAVRAPARRATNAPTGTVKRAGSIPHRAARSRRRRRTSPRRRPRARTCQLRSRNDDTHDDSR